MKLALPAARLEHYKSASQRARVVTEAWAAVHLYCPNCPSPALTPSAANWPAVDYTCPRCDSPFQLKSQGRPFARRITDAAYRTMLRAIQQDRTPNLLALHYEPEAWQVRNLLLIPRFVFSASVLEKRPPLGPEARRAGCVGCNIVLANIPPDARIGIIVDGSARHPEEVRREFARLRPIASLSVEARGWTLDVLKVIRSLGKREFTLSEVYAFEDDLAKLHPANRHIRDKIRQQLQVLRDLGFLEFASRGLYRMG